LILNLSNERSSFKTTKIIDFEFNKEYDFMKKLSENNVVDDCVDEVPKMIYEDSQKKLVEKSASPFKVIAEKFQEKKNKVDSDLDRIRKHLYPESFKISKSDDSKITYKKMFNLLNTAGFIKTAYKWKHSVYSVLSSCESLDISFVSESGNIVEYNPEIKGQFYISGKRVRMGFMFSDIAEASLSESSSEISIMINPLLSKDFIFEDFMDAAFHECAHIWLKHHDERFDVKVTELRRKFRRSTKVSEIRKSANKEIKIRYLDVI
jgi:hypothetical protein